MRNRPQRNNNPVNLRFAGQTESTGQDQNGFAIFPTPEAGWRAAHAQIVLDKSRGLTLKEFIFKFAPPTENDTQSYYDFVSLQYGFVAEDANLSEVSTFGLAGIMAAKEGYFAK